MFNWLFNLERLTKIGWIIVIIAIGIPTINLITDVVGMVKRSFGYESTETKLAKAKSNVETLNTIVNDQAASIKENEKINKMTIGITENYSKNNTILDKVTNKAINDIIKNNYKHIHDEKVVSTDDTKKYKSTHMAKHTTNYKAKKHIKRINKHINKKRVVVDKEAYGEIGRRNIDIVHDVYNTIASIK